MSRVRIERLARTTVSPARGHSVRALLRQIEVCVGACVGTCADGLADGCRRGGLVSQRPGGAGLLEHCGARLVCERDGGRRRVDDTRPRHFVTPSHRLLVNAATRPRHALKDKASHGLSRTRPARDGRRWRRLPAGPFPLKRHASRAEPHSTTLRPNRRQACPAPGPAHRARRRDRPPCADAAPARRRWPGRRTGRPRRCRRR